MSENMNEGGGSNRFELFAAILLGIAAIATAFASLESALYGGNSVEGYSKANKLATAAAAERSRAVVEMSKDTSIDLDAMRLILEADDAPSPAAEERNYQIATYLYTSQMSDAAYKALELPPEAKTAARAAEESEEVEEQNAAINEQLLEKAMEKDLAGDEGYRTAMLAKSQQQFDEADKVFKEGKDADETGDKFDLIAVLLAISLFFGGIVQVFHDQKMKWAILAVSAVLLIVGTVYMLTLPLIFD